MPRARFHHQIEAALTRTVEMIALVDHAVGRVTEALIGGDLDLADRVISQDDAIDAVYHELELTIHEMFARQAPVAGDLRALMAIVRIIGDLERAGDLALNIAKTVRRLYPASIPDQCGQLLARMSDQARVLLRAAADAVHDLEPETAERLDLMDDVVDDLATAVFRAIADSTPRVDVTTAMHLALVARSYERIADHAVSVAERVEFVVTGTAHESHVGL